MSAITSTRKCIVFVRLTYSLHFWNLQGAQVEGIVLNSAELQEEVDCVDEHKAYDDIEKVHHTLTENLNLKLESIQLPGKRVFAEVAKTWSRRS